MAIERHARPDGTWARLPLKLAALGATAAMLAGCVSFGAEPPERLYTLTPTVGVPAGTTVDGRVDNAVAVLEPGVAQRLNVTRIPVQVDYASIAYLQDAVWVERPARLFQHLVAETIRVRRGRLVLDDGPAMYSAPTKLAGQLAEMGYDVASSTVIVRYDAMLTLPGGEVRTRRFEASVPGVTADAAAVGPALNQAANQVAVEVADWIS